MNPADFQDANLTEDSSTTRKRFSLPVFPVLIVLATLAVLALRLLSPNGAELNITVDFTQIVTGLASVLALMTALKSGGDRRKGWLYIASGCIAWGIGFDSTGTSSRFVETLEIASYLLAVVGFVAGVTALSRVANHTGDRWRWLLELVPSIFALSVINWTLVVGSQVELGGPWSLDVATGIIHGLGNSVLLSVSLAAMFRHGTGAALSANRFLFPAAGFLAIADSIWLERANSKFSFSITTMEMAAGVAFLVIAAVALFELVNAFRRPGGGIAIDVARADDGAIFSMQFFALGSLLVLSAILPFADTSAPGSNLIASASALLILMYIVVRQSLVFHGERTLHSRISELNQQLDGLISQVGRDPLTGLLNHRAVHERLDLEIAGGRASGGSVAIVLIDVDNFKTINDTLGHQAGDRVLRAVSTILVSACRGSDVAARYAGDEFMLILPGLDERNAGNVCERIATEVRRLNSDLHLGGGIQVTLSIGVAVTHNCDRNVVQNVAIADAAMYDAKESGKNQVVVVNADTLQISPPLSAAPTVDQLMAESRALFEWETVSVQVG